MCSSTIWRLRPDRGIEVSISPEKNERSTFATSSGLLMGTHCSLAALAHVRASLRSSGRPSPITLVRAPRSLTSDGNVRVVPSEYADDLALALALADAADVITCDRFGADDLLVES